MVNIDYLYNPDAARKSFKDNYFVDKKLGFRIINHGTILPYKDRDANGQVIFGGLGGVFNEDGEFIRESHIHFGTGGAYTPPPTRYSTQFGDRHLFRNFLSCLGARHNRQPSSHMVSYERILQKFVQKLSCRLYSCRYL